IAIIEIFAFTFFGKPATPMDLCGSGGSSAATANSSSPMSNWTEIRANTISYYYFGQPSYWRQNENPTNSNYLSKQEIFQLTHHSRPFNPFRP
ncbi:MAG: hypothetical protein H7196_02705, partial [candidate division SR1 bacterium]|nr:hypothetical protein [candidate division SR1 bacterium]